MKIGIDCRVLSGPMCGVARYLTNLLTMFSEIDKENQYVLFSDSDFLDDIKLNSNFLKVIVTSKSNLIWEQFILPRAIMKYKVNLFHCPQNYGISFNKLCKVIITMHDLIPKIFPVYWKNRSKTGKIMYNLSLGISVLRADKIIAVSNNTREDIINIFNLPENKVTVIYEGVSFRPRTHNSGSMIKLKKYGIEGNYIMHISGIGFNKNTDTVLSAYKKLRENNDFAYNLVIVGSKSFFSRQVLNKASQIKGVIFTDFVSEEDMESLYSGASAFLYPSLYEGFGLPVLEAMSCGVPVIVSNNSSLPEVVGDSGLYVNPHNIDDLSNKILLIFQDANLRLRLIESGLKRADTFSWREAADKTIKVYKEVLN